MHKARSLFFGIGKLCKSIIFIFRREYSGHFAATRVYAKRYQTFNSKMRKSIFILISFLALTACGQSKVQTPENAMNKFDQFKLKEKFIQGDPNSYPGIADENLRPILTKMINQTATDFENISKDQKATDKDYQNAIAIGLKRFTEIYLDIDTEDRERICLYFEELMDIVNLQSSDGQLNTFMFGFDPNTLKKP